MFGETEGTQVDAESGGSLEKLEHVARVLRAVPNGMGPKVRLRSSWFLSIGSDI